VKVVIPAAGLGIRFLPATKSQPKEMLPVLDRPVIQYVVEEAVASGADEILIVTGREKRSIEDHFDRSPDLGKWRDHPELRHLEELSQKARIHYVRQREPKGLADAVGCARHYVGSTSFGVLLGDTINVCTPPLLRQLWDVYEEFGHSVIAVETVPNSKVRDYGIVEGRAVRPGVYRCHRFLEKPTLRATRSRLGITGAYVFTPGIFDAIRKTRPGRGQELQLTDAIAILARTEPVYAAEFRGTRYDIGDRLGWIRTNLEFALRHPDYRDRLSHLLKEMGEGRS